MARQKKIYGHRALLNQAGFHSTAAIVAEVDMDADSYDSPTFKISDCSHTVSLEFTNPKTATEDEYLNDMNKLWEIELAVREFSKGMRLLWRRSRK